MVGISPQLSNAPTDTTATPTTSDIRQGAWQSRLCLLALQHHLREESELQYGIEGHGDWGVDQRQIGARETRVPRQRGPQEEERWVSLGGHPPAPRGHAAPSSRAEHGGDDWRAWHEGV